MTNTGKRFWELICDHRPHISYLFSLLVALGVITLISLTITETGSAGHIIAVVNLVILGVVFIPVGYCLWKCKKVHKYADE